METEEWPQVVFQNDGTLCAGKLACTVWRRGKPGERIKGLPIPIISGGRHSASGCSADALLQKIAVYRSDARHKDVHPCRQQGSGGGDDPKCTSKQAFLRDQRVDEEDGNVKNIADYAQFAADVIFPRRCPFCGEVVGPGACAECAPYLEDTIRADPAIRIERDLEFLDAAISPYWYEDLVQQAILSMKKAGQKQTARTFAEAMCRALERCPFDDEIEAIVPVPSSRGEYREKGYSVPRWLAKYVSRGTRVPENEKLLVKSKETHRQVGLTGEQRRKNLKHAFHVLDGAVIPNTVLLIDDVFTTGSTLNECARALKKAGVKKCCALTIAVTRR